MRRTSRWWCLCVLGAVVAGCDGGERDDRPVFHIDPSQPFRIEFGRGSGRDGLDTVRIEEDGRAVIHRSRRELRDTPEALGGKAWWMVWDRTTLQLPPDGLKKVIASIESNGLMSMGRAYHGGVADGTQWVFWVKQGTAEKSIYFDNNFPRAITRFADELDAVSAAAGLGAADWQPVPEKETRSHERELWDSIRRR